MSWEQVAADIEGRGRAHLSGDELDRLVDAYFWLDRLADSQSACRDAVTAHVAAGDRERAARSAWRLFYDHWLVGEVVVARGWLEQARTWVADPSSAVAGWLAIADADVALAEQRPVAAVELAGRALAVARAVGDVDLEAMALQAAGRADIAAGERGAGLARLDRAMVMVVGNRLDPLYTGWIFCNVVATCHEVADLERAAEWSDAALRWCDDLRSGRLYPGLCRVYAAELALWRGDWSAARDHAERASADLAAHDERYAGAAHYVLGEVDRLRGALDLAEEAYARAHALGVDPQPGLALVQLARGDVTTALRAVLSALRPGPGGPLPRTTMVAALAELAMAAGDEDALAVAELELSDLVDEQAAAPVRAIATFVRGEVAAWRGDADTALLRLREAAASLRELGLPLHLARCQARIGQVAGRVGDDLTARVELSAARTALRSLGATDELEALEAALREHDVASTSQGGIAGTNLSPRELEVLRHVARGTTNRGVAEALHISPHTVARHLANVYAKLGVESRTAAAAWAFEHGLAAAHPPVGVVEDGQS